MTKQEVIEPGARIGVLGAGQLGRMFAIAARQMGYRVATFSPEADAPAGQVADIAVVAPYADLDAVAKFAQQTDVVTFEFENVPLETARTASNFAPLRPAGTVLHTTQNRLREKTFLHEAGIPVARFAPVGGAGELEAAIKLIGSPAVLKTAGSGYDGKGQAKILEAGQAQQAWQAIGKAEAVLEEFVDFEKEVSVVAARGRDGSFVHFGVIENEHQNHILDVSMAPAAIPEKTAREAGTIARTVMEKLDVIGVLCVEFFLKKDGTLLVNELAPRPHNSGHLTIDACLTSQFEQQLRAICGLPLGSTEQLRGAAMANLLGDLWKGGTPDWGAACAVPGVRLHLYGKAVARPGRKMGHLTALAPTPREARATVVRAREALINSAHD